MAANVAISEFIRRHIKALGEKVERMYLNEKMEVKGDADESSG